MFEDTNTVQTAPLGATTRIKVNEQHQHAFSLCVSLFSDIVGRFYEY